MSRVTLNRSRIDGLVLGDGVKVTHSPYLLGSPIRFRPQILVALPAAQGPL